MLTPLESWCEDFPVSCLHVVLQSLDRALAWWKIDYCLGYQTVIWTHFHFSFSSAAELYAFIKVGVICFEIHEVRLHTCQTIFFLALTNTSTLSSLKLFRNRDVQVKQWWNKNERLGTRITHSSYQHFLNASSVYSKLPDLGWIPWGVGEKWDLYILSKIFRIYHAWHWYWALAKSSNKTGNILSLTEILC